MAAVATCASASFANGVSMATASGSALVPIELIAPIRALLPPELTEGDAPVGQLLGVMQECADQINMLSKQLLGFRSDGIELQLRPTPVRHLVQRALSLAKPALGGIEVRIDVAAEAMVNCAPALMLQVLTNLLENAAYAAGKGGWVEVTGRVVNGRIVLEVAATHQASTR